MNLIDEQHTVTLITIDGVTTQVASARLNEDDSLETLREDVMRESGRIANDVMPAFDAAFAECEAKPGNVVVVDMHHISGTVRVERRLAA